MKAESNPWWIVLETLLLRDWWDSELACRIFTGFVQKDSDGDYVADAGRLCILDLDMGEEHWETDFDDAESSFNSSGIYEKKNSEWAQYLMLWKYSTHDRSSSNLRNEDEWSREYCVRWALRKRIDIPWLEWAIEKGYLPADIRDTVGNLGETPKVAVKEAGQRKTENLYRLISILVEMMVNPDLKSQFHSQSDLKKEITENYEESEDRNTGLSVDSLNRTFAEMNKIRPPKEISPDD